MRNPNFVVSGQILHKQCSTTTEDGQRLGILDLGSRGILLSIKQRR